MYKIYNQDVLENGTVKKEIVDDLIKRRIKTLYCDNMVYLKHVPKIHTLEYLVISHCIGIKQLPKLPKLKILICNDTGLINIPLYSNLEYLDCNGCRSLKMLPASEKVPKLQVLDCSGCRVPVIPNYNLLTFLNCKLCNKINKIPFLPKLNELICENSFMKKKSITDINSYKMWLRKVKNITMLLKNKPLNKDLIRYMEKFL